MLSWSILQYFWPALSDNRSWKPIFGLLFEWPLKTGFTVLVLFHEYLTLSLLVVTFVVCWKPLQTVWTQTKRLSWSELLDTLIVVLKEMFEKKKNLKIVRRWQQYHEKLPSMQRVLKVFCYSCLLKCLRSFYGKQCGTKSDCSFRSSLFWVQAVCFYT